MNLALGGEEGGRFAAQLTNKDPAALVHVLRQRDERTYSLAVLAELLGVSKATVHRLAKREDEHGG